MQGRYDTSCNATTRSRKRRRPAPQELNGVGLLRVPRHMLGGFCTVRMGGLTVTTRPTRFKLPAQLDQALDVDSPAPAHGLRFIAVNRDRATHRATGTCHCQHAVFDLSHIDLVAVTIGAGMHYLPKKCRNISMNSQSRTQQVGTAQSIAIHKGISTIVVTISPLPNTGHFHFGSNQ